MVPAHRFRRIDVAESWRRARSDYAALGIERDALKVECEELRRERDQMCDLLRLAHALVRRAKDNTGAELERLIRQRDIERAKVVTRDGDTKLQ